MSYFDAFNATEAARVPGLIENNNSTQSRLNDALLARQDARRHEHEMKRLRSEREDFAAKDHQNSIGERDRKIRLLEAKLDDFAENEKKWKDELDKRDSILLEWMHACEGYKQLNEQYGERLGLTVEQTYYNTVVVRLQIADEDARFSNTAIAQDAQQRLSKSPLRLHRIVFNRAEIPLNPLNPSDRG